MPLLNMTKAVLVFTRFSSTKNKPLRIVPDFQGHRQLIRSRAMFEQFGAAASSVFFEVQALGVWKNRDRAAFRLHASRLPRRRHIKQQVSARLIRTRVPFAPRRFWISHAT